MDERPDTANAVLTIAETAIAVLSVYMMVRVVVGADGMKVLQMKTALALENTCQKQAQMWAHLADRSRNMYDSARSV